MTLSLTSTATWVLGALLLTSQAEAQSPRTSQSLVDSLASFEVISVTTPTDNPETFTTQVETVGNLWTLALRRENVWAPGAVALVIGEGGERSVQHLAPSKTYRGTILEVPGATVSASFVDGEFHALLNVPGVGLRALQPTGLGDGLTLSYSKAQLRPEMSRCEQPTLAQLRVDPRDNPGAPGANRGRSTLPGAHPSIRPGTSSFVNRGSGTFVADLGVDSDYEYFQFYGSVSNVQDAVAQAVNDVNQAYERDVGIRHQVGLIVIRTDQASDPYISRFGSQINLEQQAEWTTQLPPYTYDLVLHFTGLDTTYDNGGTGLIGKALGIGVVCDRQRAFCYSERRTSNITQAQYVGHELGHLWNGRHCDTDVNSSCIGVGPCLLMCSVLNACNNNSTVEFAPCNAARVIAHRDSRTCLDVDALWVQFQDCGFTCGENGTFDFPFSSLTQTLFGVSEPQTIKIFAGTTADAPDDTFPLVIDKHVILEAFRGGDPPVTGVVTIGG